MNLVRERNARGSTVSFYGTGSGAMPSALADGYLAISTPYSVPVNPDPATIRVEPATILYAGDTPNLSTGVFQINATIPTNIEPAAVSLNVGGVPGKVTVSVK